MCGTQRKGGITNCTMRKVPFVPSKRCHTPCSAGFDARDISKRCFAIGIEDGYLRMISVTSPMCVCVWGVSHSHRRCGVQCRAVDMREADPACMLRKYTLARRVKKQLGGGRRGKQEEGGVVLEQPWVPGVYLM